MIIIAVAVALSALIALGIGLSTEVAQTGLMSPTLGLAVIGGLVALATLRGGSPSAFLRTLFQLFAVEFVIITAVYAATKVGWWPAGLSAIAPPVILPVTIGLFALICFAISYIPVIRTIMRHADPYFDPSNSGQNKLPILGLVTEWKLARGLVMALVLINQAQVGINVRLSFFNRDWFNAIQNKDQAAFWSLLLTVFLFWAMISVVSNLIEYFFENVLKIRWRDQMAARFSASWLDRGTHYRMGLAGAEADNPDQRIAEDVRSYINSTYAFSISLISTISNLVSFSVILLTIPAQFAIPGTDIIVPGLPFWVALIYSVIGTWLTHLIGRPLIKLDFNQERHEADFRYALARLREYGEQVALLKGEGAEKANLAQRFRAIVQNYYALVVQNLKLNTFVSTYFQASVVVPYIITAPAYFAGNLTLGQMTQTAGAFGRVEGAMQWFIARYQSLASYKAVVDRLTTFGASMDTAETVRAASRITMPSIPGNDVAVNGLTLSLPNGRPIAAIDLLVLKAGEAALLTGPSGSGKSTLFRAIAGIWPYGEGTVGTPAGKSVMLLPQRPYLPQGTLRAAVSYPGVAGDFSDVAIRQALEVARLPQLVDRLDEEALWAQVLSGGEQQRLAVARALLASPDWLFLDEATAALDEKTEAAVYLALRQHLPGTTIVSIGHRSTLAAFHDRRVELEAGEDGLFRPRELAKA
jgi:vitamin B12/bleomycin/antimicrobial peptide transport system ATP-binding/permease protein